MFPRMSQLLQKKDLPKLTICIEGNIGSGKTTFLSYLKDSPDIQILEEPLDKWNNVNGFDLFGAYMKDPKEWTFTFQTYVIQTIMEIQTKPCEYPIKVSERSLLSVKNIFLKEIKEHLHPVQISILENWINTFLGNPLMNPDFIIYLRTNPNVALNRVKTRARNGESSLDIAKITRLHELHDAWLLKGDLQDLNSKIIILDADQDQRAMREDAKKLMNDFKRFF